MGLHSGRLNKNMAKSIMHRPRPRVRPFTWLGRLLLARRQASDPIAHLMHRRVGEVQRGEYDPIGIVTDIHTAAGAIIFPPPDSWRPSLGRFHSDSQVDLIDPWQYPSGLPSWFGMTDEWCPHCKAVCQSCNDKKFWKSSNPWVLSDRQMLIDGGTKTFHAGQVPCMHGHFLEVCGGTGMIGEDMCPTCDGTGAVQCDRCAGTGLMSTGHTPDGKICGHCGGTEKVREEHKQDPAQYWNPDLSEPGYFALGPILSLQIVTPERFPEIWLGQADGNGNYPHLVIPEHIGRGSRGVISLLGVLKKHESPRNQGQKFRHGGPAAGVRSQK